jgi:hypothetical protein
LQVSGQLDAKARKTLEVCSAAGIALNFGGMVKLDGSCRARSSLQACPPFGLP